MFGRRSLAGMAFAWALAGAMDHARAEAAPRFELDECAWFATHVVVASEGASIDGRLAVMESWAGGLPAGAAIHLPALSAFAPRETRLVREGFGVSGARMVLFLRREEGAGTWESPLFRGGVGEGAVCWIEDGEVYAVDGQSNRVGTHIRRLSKTEPALRDHVLRVREARTALDEIRTREDVEQRLAGAAKYVTAESRLVQDRAFDVIRDCGKAAVPFLVSLVGPESDWRLEWRACQALGKIGDASAVKPLVDLLEAELAFWREAQVTLREGWWKPGVLDWSKARSYQVRFDRVEDIMKWALEEIAAPGYEDVVRRTRALWASAPVLRDAHEGRIVKACDAALMALERKQRGAE